MWRNLRKRNLLHQIVNQSNRISYYTQILLRQFDWVTQVTLMQNTPHGKAASYIGCSCESCI